MTDKATPVAVCEDCKKKFYLKYKARAHKTVKGHTLNW